MKELERTTTRTITETKTVYVAKDGEEFTDKEQCEKYEASAISACRARLNMKKIKKGGNIGDASEKDKKLYWADVAFRELFDYGYESDLYRWTPKSEEEIKTFIQWWELATGERPLKKEELGSDYACLYLSYPDELEVSTEYFVSYEYDYSHIRVINRTTLGNALEKILDTLSDGAE